MVPLQSVEYLFSKKPRASLLSVENQNWNWPLIHLVVDFIIKTSVLWPKSYWLTHTSSTDPSLSKVLVGHDSVEAQKNANLQSYQFAIQTPEDCLRGYVALTKLVEGARKGNNLRKSCQREKQERAWRIFSNSTNSPTPTLSCLVEAMLLREKPSNV